MKHFIFVGLIFVAFQGMGQIPEIPMLKSKAAEAPDLKSKSGITVVYPQKMLHDHSKAKFRLNGQPVDQSVLRTLNHEGVNQVDKRDDIVYISTKEAYVPAVITLNALLEKHTSLGKKPALFMIDQELIKEYYEQYVVDENAILKIVVEDIAPVSPDQSMYLVHITTKYQRPARGNSGIRIRGASYSDPN